MPLWVQVPIPASMVICHRQRTISSVKTCLSCSSLKATNKNCLQWFSALTFSKSFFPCHSRGCCHAFSRMLPNSLNQWEICQDFVGQVGNQKRRQKYSHLHVYLSAICSRGSTFFWNSRWWEIYVERGYCQNCSVNQDQRILWNLWWIPIVLAIFWLDLFKDSLFVTPDQAAWNVYQTFVELLRFLTESNVFSILQFLGNFSRSSLVADDSFAPTRHTHLFFLVEPDLPIDLLDATVIFGIQAHVVTQLMHILNFFVPNLWSPWHIQSNTIFSELNFLAN